MPWIQATTPISGSVGLSALVAAIPLAVVFTCLAALRLKAHQAASLALASALAVAVTAWGMPVKLAALAAAQGAAFGLFPVFFIVLASLFLYRITVKGGQFEVIRASIAGVTPDRRLQALLIAFCFGAFIEGCAGFGAPVAIAGATLVGLGFAPLEAASLCLVANTAPVAFGTIGIPIVAMAGATGLNDAGLLKLSAMVGRQLPFVSLVVPLYMVLIMVGFRRAMEVLPAIAACGLTFALCQFATANFLGPSLPDLLASLSAMAALMILLRFWRPGTVHRFGHEEGLAAETHAYSRSQILRAWTPYVALTAIMLLWGQPSVKALLGRATVMIPVPWPRQRDRQGARGRGGSGAARRAVQAGQPRERRLGRLSGRPFLGLRLRARGPRDGPGLRGHAPRHGLSGGHVRLRPGACLRDERLGDDGLPRRLCHEARVGSSPSSHPSWDG
jgi:lactate permease